MNNTRSSISPKLSSLSSLVIDEFGEGGSLSQHVHQYRSRQVQTDMAVAVSEAMIKKTNLILEAGTGVGKTFAYLIPALLSGKQVVVSTGSKNLQEQLFLKDLPALLSMLDITPRIALLKGRSNYLCQLRLDKQMQYASQYREQELDDLLKTFELKPPHKPLSEVTTTSSTLFTSRTSENTEDCKPSDEDAITF